MVNAVFCSRGDYFLDRELVIDLGYSAYWKVRFLQHDGSWRSSSALFKFPLFVPERYPIQHWSGRLV